MAWLLQILVKQMNKDQAKKMIVSLGGVANAESIQSQIVYPCVGFDLLGKNFIHKQCEQVPTHFSSLDNSWSDDYAVGEVVTAEMINDALAIHLGNTSARRCVVMDVSFQ